MAAFGLRVNQVQLGANAAGRIGEYFLANSIDGRVGNLCKELFKVVIKQLRLFAEHCQGRVVAHCAQRVDTLSSHGTQEFGQILQSVAEGALALQQRLGIGYGQLAVERYIFQLNGMLLQPLAIRMLAGDLVLDFVIANNASLLGIDNQHATGAQAILFHDGGRIDIYYAYLGGQHDGVIFGDVVAGRTQAIAVQCGANSTAIGEGHGGGAVPGFN